MPGTLSPYQNRVHWLSYSWYVSEESLFPPMRPKVRKRLSKRDSKMWIRCRLWENKKVRKKKNRVIWFYSIMSAAVSGPHYRLNISESLCCAGRIWIIHFLLDRGTFIYKRNHFSRDSYPFLHWWEQTPELDKRDAPGTPHRVWLNKPSITLIKP